MSILLPKKTKQVYKMLLKWNELLQFKCNSA